MAVLAFDLGGSSIKYALVNNLEIDGWGSLPTPGDWLQFVSLIKKVKSDFYGFDLEGVAFSSPGVINMKSRQIEGVSAIKYIHYRPIFDELEEIFRLPVAIENDGNCAGLAESSHGAAKGYKEAAIVVIGTGIGGSIIRDGKLYRGSHLFGGEFGYTFLGDGHALSDFGSVVKTAKRYCRQRGLSENHHSGKEMFDFASQGDEMAIASVNTFLESLAVGLFNIQLMLDPEVIVLGGGVSSRNDLIEAINSRMHKLFEKSSIRDFFPKIVCSHFKNDANLIGAVVNFNSQVKEGHHYGKI